MNFRSKIFDNKSNTDFLNSEMVIGAFPSFAGHIIHREILFVREYEQELASILWNYWNNNVLVLVYAALPKGEMGINPVYKDLKYKIFKLSVDKFGNIFDSYPTTIKIVPQLMNPKLGIMRAPHKVEPQ